MGAGAGADTRRWSYLVPLRVRGNALRRGPTLSAGTAGWDMRFYGAREAGFSGALGYAPT